jgi:hypothetical protein
MAVDLTKFCALRNGLDLNLVNECPGFFKVSLSPLSDLAVPRGHIP